MKVEYTDEIMGNSPGKIELKDLVEHIIDDSTFSEGKIEGIDNKVNKLSEMMGKLINTLAEKKVLDSEDINIILQNYKYSNYRLLRPAKINYVVGDATDPRGEGKKVIAHICNDGVSGKPAWGAGFVLALSKRWKEPEDYYRQSFKKKPPILGDVQFVQVEKDIWVANMVAQKSIRSANNSVPLVYSSLQETLLKVVDFAKEQNARIVMPRIGSGLAGGSWNKIEFIIEDTLIREGLEVIIYDLPKKE